MSGLWDDVPNRSTVGTGAGPATGILNPSSNATNGVFCATRREAGVIWLCPRGRGATVTGATPHMMTPIEHDPALEPDAAPLQLEDRRRGRGQAAVDRERAAEQREAAAADRDDDAAGRDQSSTPTDQGDLTPGHAAEGGELARVDAAQRTSDRRRAAEDREHAAADRDEDACARDQSQTEADRRTSNRGLSARDRERAAADRRAAIADRIAADGEHAQARAQLRRAQLDQLTGAFGREMGMLILEREIDRARHGSGRLVLGYIDVDGLKQVNDRRGHLAGDGLLRDIADAIQEHLRAYDTLVRVGGDEFVCAHVDCTAAIARSRCQQMRATIHDTQPPRQ
jgi:GGDEF domain-containing protein